MSARSCTGTLGKVFLTTTDLQFIFFLTFLLKKNNKEIYFVLKTSFKQFWKFFKVHIPLTFFQTIMIGSMKISWTKEQMLFELTSYVLQSIYGRTDSYKKLMFFRESYFWQKIDKHICCRYSNVWEALKSKYSYRTLN